MADHKETNPDSLKYYDFFSGTLNFRTPLHLGGIEISMDTDAPLLKDPNGRVYIPGSSIVGPLRARATELFPKQMDLLDKIFGFQKVSDQEGQENDGAMSKLLVEDAYPNPEKDMQYISIRDHVAIDRETESASPRKKFDMETTSCNPEFRLNLRVELKKNDPVENIRYIIQTVLQEFASGKIKIGGAKTRGLGRCKYDYKAQILDFSNNEHVIDYLAERKTDALPELKEVEKPPSIEISKAEEIDIYLNFKVSENDDISPFLIKSGRDDSDFDAVFATVKNADNIEIDYIPGSSIKGVFRARAEKILRTLGGENACCNVVSEQSCSEKIKKAITNKTIDANDGAAIINASCPICRLFGSSYLGGRLTFDDAFFYNDVLKKELNNVCIDRFTSGALEGKLFESLLLIKFGTQFHIQVNSPANFDKTLMLFIMRDLIVGFPPLRFGYGKSKGFGMLKFKSLVSGNEKINDNDSTADLIKIFGSVSENWWAIEEEVIDGKE